MKVMKVESLQFFMLLTDNILMTLNFSNKETPKNKVQGCVKVLNFNFFLKKSNTTFKCTGARIIIFCASDESKGKLI